MSRKRTGGSRKSRSDKIEGPIWFDAVPDTNELKPPDLWLKDAEQDRLLAVLASRYLGQNARDLKNAVDRLWRASRSGAPLVEFLETCERRANWHEHAAMTLRAVIARLCLVSMYEVDESGRRVDSIRK